MIRDILLQVWADERRKMRLDLAIDLARRHQARIIALFPVDVPRFPDFVETPIQADLYQREVDRLTAVAETIAAEFDEETRRQGVPGEWRCEEGDTVAILLRHSRAVDILVLTQEWSAYGRHDGLLPAEVAMAAGRPVLIVPGAGQFAAVGRRVLVAWSATREATRAVHDALPILRRADEVVVFSVNPPDSTFRIPGADIAAHLAAHGVKADVRHAEAPDLEVGDVLLNAVANHDADLLVMGAYGHSRLRQLVMGGASRHVLRHMTVPVLMSH